MYYA